MITPTQCEYGSLLGKERQCKHKAAYMSKSGNIFLCADHILANSAMYVPLGVTGEVSVSRLKLIKNNVKPLVLSKNRLMVVKG